MFTTIALAAAPFHPGPGWGPGPGFWIVPAIFWLLIIGLIITLVATRRRRWARAGWGGPWGPHGAGPWASAQAAHNAETVLAERFARGDIDEVEYRARLEVLRSQQVQPPQS
jgi:putative membrane protein